ncbi:hypothetical protein Brsp07_04617 [Brucella sp. NBRC 14130]|uniref:hypothetical protein n=1 Tax=Brucella sp. NBRC 14130 TaxID=3075483 RepID=UPI0030988B89
MTRERAKIAGEIVGNGVAVVGETLADALNVDTWTQMADTIPPRTPEQEATARRQLEEWERSVKANPPKKIA